MRTYPTSLNVCRCLIFGCFPVQATSSVFLFERGGRAAIDEIDGVFDCVWIETLRDMRTE